MNIFMKFSFSSIINMGNFDQLWNQLEAFRQIETRYVLRNKLIKYTFSLKKRKCGNGFFLNCFFFPQQLCRYCSRGEQCSST